MTPKQPLAPNRRQTDMPRDKIEFASYGDEYTAHRQRHPDRFVVDADWCDMALLPRMKRSFPLTRGSINSADERPDDMGAEEALHRFEALRYDLIRAYLSAGGT